MKLVPPPASCKVYTPSALADAMVSALGDAPHASWLEPSHGKGSFVEAISRLGVGRERILAIDLDTEKAESDRLATCLRGIDFLCWARTTDERVDRIVGNPPFIPIKRLPRLLQAEAASVLDETGYPIGKKSNLWYAFVLASARLLRRGGCISFLLPAAAAFANYCQAMRKAVAQNFRRLDLYWSKRPLFDEVQEGTLVAVARGFGLGPGNIHHHRFSTRSALIRGLSIDGCDGTRCKYSNTNSQHARGSVTLGSVAKIGLGAVTGDVGFFLMNESKRKNEGLPTKAFIPVVSKARHLRCTTLSKEKWERLRNAGERTWLFNPTASMLVHPNVKRYLELAAEEGGCNRRAYKVSIRDPWYRTPMPTVPDAFLSGMSQHGPWLCINETQNVNATNTLYVVTFSSRDTSDWYMWALALLTTEARRQIRRIGRRYPDGLVKYEPGPLREIILPRLKPIADYARLYRTALSFLLSGNPSVARRIADSMLLGSHL